MLHALTAGGKREVIHATEITVSGWGISILLTVTGYPILLSLLKEILMLLYRILIQYQF